MKRNIHRKTLHKKLVHRTINATYESKRSRIVMLAILFMVGVHLLMLSGFDGIFAPRSTDEPEFSPYEVSANNVIDPQDVIDIDLRESDDPILGRTIKTSRVGQGYNYPSLAEYTPEGGAFDLNVPDVDGALQTPQPFHYALKNTRSDKARIAIMIDDMGMNRKQSLAAIEMDDVPLTLAFLPYAPDLESLTKPALAARHELMIHMPMEPMSSKVPLGPISIKDSMEEAEVRAMLDKAYASFEGYTGMNNHMGSRATQNKRLMDVVMDSLDAHGLFYVDSKTINTSVAADAARDRGLPHAERDVFLDHQETLEFARNALHHLEEIALKDGHAIAIGHPKENTIKALKEWIPTLEARGFEIVPVSELLMTRQAGMAPATAKIAQFVPPPVKAKPKAVQAQQPKRLSVPKFILNKPDEVSADDLANITPAAGDAEPEPEVATEDLLSAPIGGDEAFEADTSDGLYSLSQ